MHNENALLPTAVRRVSALILTAALFLVAGLAATRAPAQEGQVEPLTAEELEILVGPIALYPDEVLAVVLPASTYPLEVVQAARFLEERAADPALEPSEEWDDSVVALLNYPDVIRLMNDDLDWTWDLGEAVLDDQAAVLDAIQAFRDRAYDAGNLVSDDRQIVSEDDGVIAISPADPEVVYIPYYEPSSVVVYQPRPVFHYYPYAYPLYYYPYPVGYRFSTGFFWGVTSAFVIGWDTHFIHLHHHTHYRHPFYRRTYYSPYYTRRGINVTVNVNNYRNVWRPRRVRGARPYDGVRAVRSGDRIYRSYDGRHYRNADRNYRGGTRTVTRSTERTVVPRDRVQRRTTATLPRQGTRRSGDLARRSGTAASRPGDVAARDGGLRQGTIDRYRERANRRPAAGGRRQGNTGRPTASTGDRSNRGGGSRSGAAIPGRRPNTFAGVAGDNRAQTRPQPRAGSTSRPQPARRSAIAPAPRAQVNGSSRLRAPAARPARPRTPTARLPSARTSRPQAATRAPSARTSRPQAAARAPSPRTSRPQAPAARSGGSRFGGVAPQRQPRAGATSGSGRAAPAYRARQPQGGSGNRARAAGAPRRQR